MSKKILDLLGNPVCEGALVSLAVAQGHTPILRWGYVDSWVNGKIKITGGTCSKPILRNCYQVIVIFMPLNPKNTTKEESLL